MVWGWMIFSEVITKVHVYWFSIYLKKFLFHLIVSIIKLHVHGFNFLLNASFHETICRGIVCDDFSGLLWLSHLSQGCPNSLELFGVVE